MTGSRHINTVGWIHASIGTVLIVFGGCLVVESWRTPVKGGAASDFMSETEMIMGVGMLLVGPVQLIAGILLRSLWQTARFAICIVSLIELLIALRLMEDKIIGLLLLPIFSIVGAYSLWALLNKESDPAFSAARGRASIVKQ